MERYNYSSEKNKGKCLLCAREGEDHIIEEEWLDEHDPNAQHKIVNNNMPGTL